MQHLLSKLYFLGLCILLIQCKSDAPASALSSYIKLSGPTMGTRYNITYQHPDNRQLQPDIDSILASINDYVSTYQDNSLISRINRSKSSYQGEIQIDTIADTVIIQFTKDVHLFENLMISRKVYESTYGYFDPTVLPLVNYWGFGYKDKKAVSLIDSQHVRMLTELTGFDKWKVLQVNDQLSIHKPLNTELDFSAVAKGYAVDYIAAFLKNEGCDNFLVEIGGELYASGVNNKMLSWTIGLNTPKDDAALNAFEAFVNLDNAGLASSGNYRNYYEVDGRKYGHEINPKTGYPEINSLLGVSVVSTSCAFADAYATAFMVMGMEKAIALIESIEHTEAIFFYGKEDGSIGKLYSSGFESYLKTE